MKHNRYKIEQKMQKLKTKINTKKMIKMCTRTNSKPEIEVDMKLAINMKTKIMMNIYATMKTKTMRLCFFLGGGGGIAERCLAAAGTLTYV